MFPAARMLRGLVIRVLVVFVAFAVLAASGPALAADYVGRTPPRLSLVEGQVSFWRSGNEDWEPAQVNLPLAPGDYLDTGVSSRAEMQIGPQAFLRASADTQLGIQAQDTKVLRLDLPQGRLALDLRGLSSGAQIEVSTPQAKLAVSTAGFYDITVASDSSSFTALQGGRAQVLTSGDVVDLRPGSMVVAGAGVGGLARYDAPPADDWARWNSERTDRILSAASRGNVSDDIYGVNDLDGQGTWRDEPSYGRVWVPSSVPVGWAPYTTGRWLWDVDYGWSWVDSAPWGWAPYHYGRWVWANSYWGWAPGPLVVPVYSPALVAFFGGPSVSVSIGFPFVSWVALGWGEPIYPWWGPSWYRGRACWGGWGGPTIINNVYVNNRNNNFHHVNHYRNQDVPNGVVAVRRNDFAHRSVERVQMATAEQRRLRPARDSMPIQPREAGVKPGRDGSRPPRVGGPVEVAGSRPPSRYGEIQTHPRSSVDLPSARVGHAEANDAAERAHRPVNDNSESTRPRPHREEVSAVPRTTTNVQPGSENLRRPPRPDRPQAPDRSTSRETAGSADPRGGGMPRVERDTWSGTRPVMPQRPLPQRPSRPVQDAYAAPTYQGFERGQSQRQAQPQRPLPDRPSRPVQDAYSAPTQGTFNRAPQQRGAPPVEMPAVTRPNVDAPPAPRYDPPAMPRQRSGADYGARAQQRPSVQQQQSMPMPSRSGGGGGGMVMGGGDSGRGNASRGDSRSHSMPAPQSHPSHGHSSLGH